MEGATHYLEYDSGRIYVRDVVDNFARVVSDQRSDGAAVPGERILVKRDRLHEIQASVTPLRQHLDNRQEDLYPDGTVIRWTQSFDSGKEYTYVALKAGVWYVTGFKSQTRLTYRELLERLTEAETIEIATEWTAV